MSAEIDAGEVALLLGVTRQHFVDRISKRLDFPKPVVNWSPRARRWKHSDVLRWRERAAGDCGKRAA